MPREAIVKSPTARPKRTKINVRNRLTVNKKDPNYEYRVVNDVEDRVELLKEIGYEVVMADDVKVGDKRVDVGSTVGKAATVSVGNATTGVVMRIRKDWYDEDQANKQEEIDKLEQSMQRQDGLYGKVEISRN